jgi:hypothetical protein
MLVTFTQKVAELDLLLEPGDRVELITSGYATPSWGPGSRHGTGADGRHGARAT